MKDILLCNPIKNQDLCVNVFFFSRLLCRWWSRGWTNQAQSTRRNGVEERDLGALTLRESQPAPHQSVCLSVGSSIGTRHRVVVLQQPVPKTHCCFFSVDLIDFLLTLIGWLSWYVNDADCRRRSAERATAQLVLFRDLSHWYLIFNISLWYRHQFWHMQSLTV